jgi:hypothetical protein
MSEFGIFRNKKGAHIVRSLLIEGKYLLQKRIIVLTISTVTLKLGKVCRKENQYSVEKNLRKSQTPT